MNREKLEAFLVEAAKAEGCEVEQAKGGPYKDDWYCNEWTNLSALARRLAIVMASYRRAA